jgi:hypothetical protein
LRRLATEAGLAASAIAFAAMLVAAPQAPAAAAAGPRTIDSQAAAVLVYQADAISGNTAVLTVGSEGPAFANYVSVMVRVGRRWKQQATLDGPPGDDGSFGETAAIAGPTLVVGCGDEDDVDGPPSAGMAYIYQRSGSHWVLQAAISPPDGPSSSESFGQGVAISASTVIITANNGAYIYVRSKSTWRLQQAFPTTFLPPVALAGYTAVIGNTVYVRSGSRWRARQVLGGPVKAAVALNDRELARGNFPPGDQVAEVYQLSGARWRLQATIPSTHPRERYGQFGLAIAIAGPALFVGAEAGARGVEQGGVYVYRRSGSRWILTQSIYEPAGPPSVYFGQTIAVSGNTMLIDAGAGAYFYERGSHGWALQQAEL